MRFYLFLKDGAFTAVKRVAAFLTSVWKRQHFCPKRDKKGKGLDYGAEPSRTKFCWVPPTWEKHWTLSLATCLAISFVFLYDVWKMAHGMTYWEVELGSTLRSDKPNAASSISRTTECNALPLICVATKFRDKLHETWPIAVLLRWELTILMPAYAEYPMM